MYSYAWQDEGKPDPGSLTVSTRCGNKLCVRHLYTRSRADAIASVTRLQASGEDSHLARLTAQKVLSIRKLYAKGKVAQAELATRFGISTGHVKNILARRSWKHPNTSEDQTAKADDGTGERPHERMSAGEVHRSLDMGNGGD